ncbi:MAG: tryptophan synthase subunit alpha [Acidimicrobiia bacterium]|nr:tryptophan synthase subunit alpha [Acidimicrobiia bacterium]
MSVGALEQTLRHQRSAGRKLLVPYVTGGLGDDWLDTVRALADAGADAIEVGIPFSDPVMDGPVIQAASEAALAKGATPHSITDALRRADVGVPVVVMTYYNIAFHAGLDRFAHTLQSSQVAAAILPDLPLEEAGPWTAAADRHDVETVLLAAPTAPDERLPLICERARGFVYAVGLLGVTGERTELARSSLVIAERCKAVTDKPVLVGVGVSDAAQAVEVCSVADGVVIGSAVVRRMLDGEGPAGVAAFVASVRAALDAG